MSTNSVFPYFFDPRSRLTTTELLDFATMHLLLFDRLTVQDNFLISELFASAAAQRKENSIREWIERGWLQVALRDNAYSLSDLRCQKLNSAIAKKYLPFEERERGILLYQAPDFVKVVEEFDTALSSGGGFVTWNEVEMGKRLRELLRSSAERGMPGLSADRALAVWNEIDQIVEGGPHGRSHYWNYVAGIEDQKEAESIRNWVTLEYLPNLPIFLSSDVSTPRYVLQSADAWDPFTELAAVAVSPSDIDAIRGRDCALLSPSFLSSIDADQVDRLRRLTEFRDLQNARATGSLERIRASFLPYLRAVGETVPRVLEPSIKTFSAQVSIKKAVTLTGEICGLLFSGPLGVTAALLSIFLGETRGTERRLAQAQARALDQAGGVHYSRKPAVTAALCHDTKNSPLGNK